jgi:hypothetical protein
MPPVPGVGEIVQDDWNTPPDPVLTVTRIVVFKLVSEALTTPVGYPATVDRLFHSGVVRGSRIKVVPSA